MGGKSVPAPKPVSTAPPTPIPDPNVNATAPRVGQAEGFAAAQQQSAEEAKKKQQGVQGLAETAPPNTRRDVGSVIGANTGGINSSAVLTG